MSDPSVQPPLLPDALGAGHTDDFGQESVRAAAVAPAHAVVGVAAPLTSGGGGEKPSSAMNRATAPPPP
jgi:hypothetical protein